MQIDILILLSPNNIFSIWQVISLIQIPNHSFNLQHFSYPIIPFEHYFLDSNVFWTFNQSQPIYCRGFNYDLEFLKEQGRAQIDVIQSDLNLPIKYHLQHILKRTPFNQTPQKSCPQESCPSSLSSQPQLNLIETVLQDITEKQVEGKNIQKVVSAKSQVPCFKKNNKQKLISSKKTSKKTQIVDKNAKTEGMEVQVQKGEKQVSHWKRTILPNIYQVIFAYLARKQKSQNRVKRLFEKIGKPNKKMSQNYTIQRYYQYQMLLKEKMIYCVNEAKFGLLKQIHDPHCRNFQLEEQMYYNKVSRIVVREFIEKELLGQLLNKERGRYSEGDEENEFYLRHMEMYRQIRSVLKRTFTI